MKTDKFVRFCLLQAVRMEKTLLSTDLKNFYPCAVLYIGIAGASAGSISSKSKVHVKAWKESFVAVLPEVPHA